MGVSRSIRFLCAEKTKAVELLHSAIMDVPENGNYKKQVEEPYSKTAPPCIKYGSILIFPEGESLEYFGGEEVFGKKYEKYKDLKLWVTMGGLNTIWIEGGSQYAFPEPDFKKVLVVFEKMLKEAGVENDIYIMATSDDCGKMHMVKQPFLKLWNGKNFDSEKSKNKKRNGRKKPKANIGEEENKA